MKIQKAQKYRSNFAFFKNFDKETLIFLFLMTFNFIVAYITDLTFILGVQYVGTSNMYFNIFFCFFFSSSGYVTMTFYQHKWKRKSMSYWTNISFIFISLILVLLRIFKLRYIKYVQYFELFLTGVSQYSCAVIYSVIFVWSNELFKTSVRGFNIGLLTMVCKLVATMCGPILDF